MHKPRYRRIHSTPPPVTSPKHEFGKAAAAGLAAGALGSTIAYCAARKPIENRREALRAESKKNNLQFSSDSTARNYYSEALGRSTAYARTSYESTLRSGGEAVGEMQWVALKNLFIANNIPFDGRYIDLSKLSLLDKTLYRRADLDRDLGEGIDRWLEVRRDSLHAPHRGESDAVLKAFVAQELYISARDKALDAETRELWKPAALAGVLSSLTVFFAFLVVRSAILARRARRQLPAPEPAPSPNTTEKKSTPSVPPCAPKNGDAALPKRKSDPPSSYVEAARNRLAEEFGLEVASAVCDALNGKLSASLARRIADGNYAPLIQLVLSSKKALELKGYDANAITSALLGKDPVSAEPANGGSLHREKRKRHPLDFVPRWGWKPGNFHRLLNGYGLDTSEVGGGGHCFVKYRGEKLRTEDGRFVQVVHRTAGREITPGAAAQILKHCADFLVRLEEKGEDKN